MHQVCRQVRNIISAHKCSMREGTVVTGVCLLPFGGGPTFPACACYVAAGMPLVLTQEKFLGN